MKNNQLNHFTNNSDLLLSMLSQAVSCLSCIWEVSLWDLTTDIDYVN